MAAAPPCTMPARKGVYVLRLGSGDKYYVGSSGDIAARVGSHTSGPKVAWVAANGGVAEVLEPVTPSEDPLSVWEMRETMARMIMHGFNNVRGWEYCSPQPLGNSDVDGIFKLICGGLSVPLCHSCGFSGHLSSACATPGRAVWLDNLMACRPEKTVTGSDVILGLIRDGGTAPRAPPKRKASAPAPAAAPPAVPSSAPTEPEALRFVSYDELAEQPAAKRRQGCSRCGRPCHVAERCYARTSAEGEQLAPA